MKHLKTALWGCGKIGKAVAEIIKDTKHEISWFYDVKLPAAAILARDTGTGKSLPAVPEPEFFPKTDLVIDATGDKMLLSYWKEVLDADKTDAVLLTRREPEADSQIMPAITGELILKHKITAIGSCTGNAVVPLLIEMNRQFKIEAASARVLHPLKQQKEICLRSIPTALSLSLADFSPELAKICDCRSMELPINRGMAIDISITFEKRISTENIADFFENTAEKHKYFSISETPLSSSKIIKTPYAAVLEPNYTINGRTLRFLIWQDNEYGFAYSIKYYLDQYAKKYESDKKQNSAVF